jgi:hypothetical protein
MRIGVIALVCAAAMLPHVAAAQTTAEQAAIIAGDPPIGTPNLVLADVPAAAGPARELFNGRDLGGWEAWLGYEDPSLTFQQTDARPLGTSVDTGQVFSVVTEDGGPAIRAGGKYWGSLIHADDMADYHLSLEYKWGPGIWPPSVAETRNNGLLYHSHGGPGTIFGTWRRSIEFQLQHGSLGMVIPLGNELRTRVRVGQDMAIPYPHRRFFVMGRAVDVANGTPAWNVEGATNAEKPVGTWNRIDLYVVGNHSVHVVNGMPVMEVDDIGVIGADGSRTPLTHGRIQLQSEGAETFFRNIRVEPIKALPKVLHEVRRQ